MASNLTPTQLVTPKAYAMKDLYIDVSLEAIINGQVTDFMGRETFTIGFFKQGVGFGITNIEIEVNTSLLPIVTITFKDLYGNTMLGRTKPSYSGGEPAPDYSVLFRWPPPKFKFTFKGYLGSSVTWILSLKQVKSVQYNSTDSSYETTVEFVPNQFGWFADLPFMYLMAVKALKRKDFPSADPNSFNTAYDLIKIGKKYTLNTQEVTKQFDILQQQMVAFRTSTLYNAIFISKIVEIGKTIDGSAGGDTIVPKSGQFYSVTISNISNTAGNSALLDKSGNVSTKAILSSASNPLFQQKLNTFLLLTSNIGSLHAFPITFSNITTDPVTGNIQASYLVAENIVGVPNPSVIIDVPNEIQKRTALIQKNLDNIAFAINAKTFNSSKDLLAALTIGDVFKRIAEDGAYIMEKIGAAGYAGAHADSNFQAARITAQKGTGSAGGSSIIGVNYPLCLAPKAGNSNAQNSTQTTSANDLEELPATQEHGFNLGVEQYEMPFINNFVNALAEGVAEELQTNQDLSATVGPQYIKNRINNLEGLSQNPYKSSFQSIVENIFVRGGIVGYLTKYNDPNYPRGLGSGFFNPGQAENASNIDKITQADAENITDDILLGLGSDDVLKLKVFCTFWQNLLTEDCQYLQRPNNDTGQLEKGDYLAFSNYRSGVNQDLTPGLLYYPVITTNSTVTTWTPTYHGLYWTQAANNAQYGPDNALYSKAIQNLEAQGMVITTLQDIINMSFLSNINGTGSTDSSVFKFIDTKKLQAQKLINNGLAYFKPINSLNPSKDIGAPIYIMFQTPQSNNIKQINSAPSDATLYNGKTDADLINTSSDNKLNGYLTVTDAVDPSTQRLWITVEHMNALVSSNNQQVLNYSKLINPPPSFFTNINLTPNDVSYFVVNQQVGDPNKVPIGDIAGTNIVYSQSFSDPSANTDEGQLVFGLFVCIGSTQLAASVLHRAFIQQVCSAVLSHLQNLETQKTQIISSILGEASDKYDVLYKQFHNLYQTWETIFFPDNSSSPGKPSTAPDFPTLSGSTKNKNFQENTRYDYRLMTLDKPEEFRTKFETAQQDAFIYSCPFNFSRSANVNTSNNSQILQDNTISNSSDVQGLIQVQHAILNVDSLYNINSNTTVLNVIQQLCSKNNFLFIPFPGDPANLTATSILSPQSTNTNPNIVNSFFVEFMPTPESRSLLNTGSNKDTLWSSQKSASYKLPPGTIEVKFGSPNNDIFKNVRYSTDSSQATAESILNTQKLVDNQNQNKVVSMNCSVLSIMEGRSYKAEVECLGNAQLFPMQFFYLNTAPLFNGLYQVMTVKHSITPNTMTSTMEGMRMRFDYGTGGGGGIAPITYETLQSAPVSFIPTTSTTQFDIVKNSTWGVGPATGNTSIQAGMNGIDVSVFQGNVDWSKVVSSGVDFAIIKVSEGIGHVDSLAISNATGAALAGLKIGYYHFAHFANDPIAEANHFISVLQKLLPPNLPLVLDVEKQLSANSQLNDGGLSPADFENWIQTFFYTLKNNPITSGAPVMIYGGQPYLDFNLPATHNLGNIPLWIAAYNNRKSPKIPVGWPDYTFWQYTDQGRIPGITVNTVDLNRAKVTVG